MTLSLKAVAYKHCTSGGNIARDLREALAALDLCEERQVAIATDYNYDAGNIIKAVQLNNWQRFHCLGHRLHLAIGKLILSTILCLSAMCTTSLFVYLYFMITGTIRPN